MKLLRNIRACETIPRGYGFAYHGTYTDTCYVALIPLNFVIGAWHNFYWYCLVRGWFNQSPLVGVQNYWRGKGFSEGEAHGYEKGVQHTLIATKNEADAAYIEGFNMGRIYVEGGPAANADRPGGIIGRSDHLVVEDDPRPTPQGSGTGAPCGSDPVSREVPEGVRAGRSELHARPLDHDARSDADAVHGDGAEGPGASSHA